MADFERFIATVERIGTIVPLYDLLAAHRAGRSTARRFALTFDDAYHDLLDTVVPFACERGMPLTIFPASAAVEQGATFWWDRLDAGYRNATAEEWAAVLAEFGVQADDARDRDAELWRVRQYILDGLNGILPPVCAALEAIEARHGSSPHRSMVFDELRTARAMHDGVTIGLHGHRHACMPALSAAEQRADIERCRAVLDRELGDVLSVFAVPYGVYDARTLEAVAAAGIESALLLDNCTLRTRGPGISRIYVPAMPSTFRMAARLTGWFDNPVTSGS